MTDYSTELEQLGYSMVSTDHLDRLVAASLGVASAHVVDVCVRPVDYPTFSIATGALLRVSGSARLADGDVKMFRIFVKQLQSARAWPMIHVIPADQREFWSASFPWRIEIDAFKTPLADALPESTRLPQLYEVVEIDDDRAALWMEDIDADPSPWSLGRYGRAGYVLGELAGRRLLDTDTKLGADSGRDVPGLALRMYAMGRLEHGALPLLSLDDSWQHDGLVAMLEAAGESTLRNDLLASVPHLPGWLDAMDGLPQTYVHGDASPQNLLVPVEAPETFVVIDWGFNSPQCVGFDLGQLLLGHVNSGDTPASMLAAIHEVIEPAYCAGLASAGFDASPDQVHRGYLMSLVVRSLFTSLPLEELDAPDSPELRHRLRERITMTRFLLELSAEVR